MPAPLVTVLMPAFNSARYLAEAIESILLQSWNDLQLIVLDGGSNDPTQDIVKAYALRDPRVRLEVFSNTAPNKRVDLILPSIRSSYIMMQHSDDISYTNRTARQLKAFLDDPALAVCSTDTRMFMHDRFNPARSEGVRRLPRPTQHEVIKANLLFWWVMNCPTLMFDLNKIREAGMVFANSYAYGNDYWQTVTNIDKVKYGNIPEELCAYRLHTASDGLTNFNALRDEERKLKIDILHHFGFEASPRELEIHSGFRLVPDQILDAKTPEEFDETIAWLNKLRQQNDEKQVFHVQIFSALIETLCDQTKALKDAKKAETQAA